jgi:hypothetical protein
MKPLPVLPAMPNVERAPAPPKPDTQLNQIQGRLA